MMEMLHSIGLLPEEYYGTPDAEGLEKDDEYCIQVSDHPLVEGIRDAASMMHTLECNGNTEQPGYMVAKSALKACMDSLTASSFETLINLLMGCPHSCGISNTSSEEGIDSMVPGMDRDGSFVYMADPKTKPQESE